MIFGELRHDEKHIKREFDWEPVASVRTGFGDVIIEHV